ncbi:MAG: hypothetical protein IPK50_11335 [Fibrobacterota bacterium]|nr:hypothetical protein [Fibrobacterota bacterium]QQS07468.1 MAG: hypothetical protein IPK50_11335 [Fibrobacterota bacterium]
MKLRMVLAALLMTSTCWSVTPLGDHTVFDTTTPPPPPQPRSVAPFVVALEMGVNAPSGVLGGRVSWNPISRVSLDAAGGWSPGGFRGGFGARWFTNDKFSSPFVGVAWKRSAGIDSASLDDGKQKEKGHVRLEPVQYVDALIGYEIRRTDGLVFVLTTGWSFAITPESKRATLVNGMISDDAAFYRDLYTGMGPILAGAVGIGF